MGEKNNNPRSNGLLFKTNERILCFHGPLLYEAKVLKAEMWDGADPDAPEPGPHYFVHYKGWKQTWDEWVDESRTLKFNEENLAKQKALKQAALQAMKKKPSTTTKSSSSKAESETESQRSRKRIRESSVEKTRDERDEGARGPEIKMPIPNALKSQLVDDWERVTKDKLLAPLPRNPTVADMLAQYQEYKRDLKDNKKRPSKHDESIIDEVVDGLKIYFDRTLGNTLLYRFERYQYQQMREKYSNRLPSEIYGPEHLLRLFVQLPGLIAHTNMDEDAVQLLKENLSDILKYMHKFSKALFAEEYENASPAYIAVTKAM